MVTKFTPRLRAGMLCALLISGAALAQPAASERTAEPPAAAASASAARAASWGSGFVVAPGYLLTAHHVVREHSRWLVGPVGTTATGRPRWLPAELLKTDPTRDLALLRIPETLPALALHPQPTVPIGLEALVIGFPQPRVQGASRKITQGIVNGYRQNEGAQADAGWLQISAEVSQGNSGGPVLAADGTVIGMVQRRVNATAVAERTQDTLVNVNYALRSSQLIDFLQDTPAQATVRPVAVQTVLRPHQIFETTAPSVLAVVGLRGP